MIKLYFLPLFSVLECGSAQGCIGLAETVLHSHLCFCHQELSACILLQKQNFQEAWGKKNLVLKKVMSISLGKYRGLSMKKAFAPTWWLTGYNRLSVLNVAVLFQEVQLKVGFLIRWL